MNEDNRRKKDVEDRGKEKTKEEIKKINEGI